MRHLIMFACINAVGLLFILMAAVFSGMMQGYISMFCIVMGFLCTALALPITISSWNITKWNSEVDRKTSA